MTAPRQFGRWTFDDDLISASDLSVRKISDGAFDPLQTVALLDIHDLI